MELIKNFSSIFVVFSAFVLIVNSLTDDEMSQLIETAETLVDQMEHDTISEQNHLEEMTWKALNRTKSTRSLFKNKTTFSKMIKPLSEIVKVLKKLNGTREFTLSSFSKANTTGCKKIHKMITRMEAQMDLCLKIRNFIEKCVDELSPQTDKLKIEYTVNYINMNTTTASKVLNNISKLEKLASTISKFSSELYSAAKQFASVLYDIKVVKSKACSEASNKKNRKITTKKLETTQIRKITKSTTKPKTTKQPNDEVDGYAV